MSQTSKELLQHCTVKLTVAGQNDHGTGFFITPELIITCAHVVMSAGNIPVKVSWVEQSGSSEAIVEKIRLAPHKLALLRSCSNASQCSPLLLDDAIQLDDELCIYGYSKDYLKGHKVTGKYKGLTEDNLSLIKFNVKTQYYLQLIGSPLLNRRTGKVCGIVSSLDRHFLAIRGRAIPMSVILSEFGVLQLQQPSQAGEDPAKIPPPLPQTGEEGCDALKQNLAFQNLAVNAKDWHLPSCNLPPRNYSKFVGRNEELKKLLRYISPSYRQHITLVEGIGGVGKTALVLEAAYRCWENRQRVSQIKTGEPIDTPLFDTPRIDTPLFDAIIFTSAKQTYLKPSSILNQPKTEGILQQIFREIALTLDDPTLTRAAKDKQLKLVYQRLSVQPTLLIVDNVEALDSQDKQDVLEFLANLPISTEAIVTTLERVVLFSSIHLNSLSEAESIQLIQQQAAEKAVTLPPNHVKRIYQRFGGIPTALIYAMGQRAEGYSLKRILSPALPLSQDVAHFLFKGSVTPLHEQPAHSLLMALAMFQVAPEQDALANVAGLAENAEAIASGLTQLQRLSLIREQFICAPDQTQCASEKRYAMLPTTREYTLAELAAYPKFETEARQRWVQWYQAFVQKRGGKDWQNWRRQYDDLAQEWENIAAVLHWCAAQDRYEDIKTLWQNVDDYVDLDGDWRTRRYWWKWLAQESDRRADISTYVKALSERGWTLTLTGKEHQSKAAHELAKAWKLRHHTDSIRQAELAKYIAVHRMTRKQYAKALTWLDRSERLMKQSKWQEREQLRHQILLLYYRAETHYRQANYESAREHFHTVIAQGKEIGWQRFVNYAQNWLADIAIVQGNLQEAADLLETGLATARASRERRRVAHFQASYARLEQARAHDTEARQWAKQALEFFIRDGMHEEAEAMQDVLRRLAVH